MEKSQYAIMHEVEKSHFWYVGMRRITEFLLTRYLPKTTERKILDAGCGTGGALLFLNKYGKTYGVDISSDAINLCKKRGLTNIVLGSVEQLPYSSGFFDVVTCFDVLYHRQVMSDEKALREFYRVLQPDGLLLIRVPAYNWLRSQHDQKVHTRHRYTTGELNMLLKKAGFQALRLTYANSMFFPLILVRRFTEKFRSFKNRNESDVTILPMFINLLLQCIFWCEYQLLKHVSLPFGLSVIAVARKSE